MSEKIKLDTIANYAPCYINVRGKVNFSHCKAKYTMEEITEANKKQIAQGRKATHNKPYCTITISNPSVVTIVDKQGNALTGEAFNAVKACIESRFFLTQSGEIRFSQEDKSMYLPRVCYSALAGEELKGQEIANNYNPLPNEFAVGLDVTVSVNLYSTPMGVGLGMSYIWVNEPIKYYTGGGAIANALGGGDIKPIEKSAPKTVETYPSTPTPTPTPEPAKTAGVESNDDLPF